MSIRHLSDFNPRFVARVYGGRIPAGRADFVDYTLTVVAGGAVKTLRADNGTMPPQRVRIVRIVREAISAARP